MVTLTNDGHVGGVSHVSARKHTHTHTHTHTIARRLDNRHLYYIPDHQRKFPMDFALLQNFRTVHVANFICGGR